MIKKNPLGVKIINVTIYTKVQIDRSIYYIITKLIIKDTYDKLKQVIFLCGLYPFSIPGLLNFFYKKSKYWNTKKKNMFFHKSKNRDKNIDKKALYKNLSLSP